MDRGKIEIENNYTFDDQICIYSGTRLYYLSYNVSQCFTKKVANRKYTVFYVHQVCV